MAIKTVEKTVTMEYFLNTVSIKLTPEQSVKYSFDNKEGEKVRKEVDAVFYKELKRRIKEDFGDLVEYQSDDGPDTFEGNER